VTAVLRIVARPALDLVAISEFLEGEATEWRRTPGMPPAEELIEFAGRVCYLSFGSRQSPKDTAAYVRSLVDQGHHSVLEHASWSFLLTGVSRAFTHQLVRHRIGFSYSQLSQQYHDESDAEAVVPAAVRRHPAAVETWKAAVDRSHVAYRELLRLLAAGHDADDLPERERLRLERSAARSVLPAATETKILFTANARALRHFLDERGAIVGDEEMRVVSALLLRAVSAEAPELFSDFVLTERGGLPLVERRGDRAES
jgi:thymidylate synthase (FAD)